MAVDPNWFLEYEVRENKFEVPYESDPLKRRQKILPSGDCFEAQNEQLKANWEKNIPRMILYLVQFEYIVTEFNDLPLKTFNQYLKRLELELKIVEDIYENAKFMELTLYDQAAKEVDKCVEPNKEEDLADFQIKIDDYVIMIDDLYKRIHSLRDQLYNIMASRHINNMTRKAMLHNQPRNMSRVQKVLAMGPFVNANAFYKANALQKAKAANHNGGKRRTKRATRKRASVKHRR
jgi:hypothetical protein